MSDTEKLLKSYDQVVEDQQYPSAEQEKNALKAEELQDFSAVKVQHVAPPKQCNGKKCCKAAFIGISSCCAMVCALGCIGVFAAPFMVWSSMARSCQRDIISVENTYFEEFQGSMSIAATLERGPILLRYQPANEGVNSLSWSVDSKFKNYNPTPQVFMETEPAISLSVTRDVSETRGFFSQLCVFDDVFGQLYGDFDGSSVYLKSDNGPLQVAEFKNGNQKLAELDMESLNGAVCVMDTNTNVFYGNANNGAVHVIGVETSRASFVVLDGEVALSDFKLVPGEDGVCKLDIQVNNGNVLLHNVEVASNKCEVHITVNNGAVEIIDMDEFAGEVNIQLNSGKIKSDHATHLNCDNNEVDSILKCHIPEESTNYSKLYVNLNVGTVRIADKCEEVEEKVDDMKKNMKKHMKRRAEGSDSEDSDDSDDEFDD